MSPNRYSVIGQIGGPGTFWRGYGYDLGTYRWLWMAKLVAWFHVRIINPWRAARVEDKGLLTNR
jgi:hypothetical protein